jgi:predicted MFS family arabinose efflux permease
MATAAPAMRANEGGQAPIPRQAWVSLVLLTMCYAIYTLDKSVVAVVIEPLKREFQLNDRDVGLLTGLASTLPFLLTCIPLGMLADRVNRKWLLIALVVLWSISTAFGGFATSLMFLAFSRAAVAAFEAGFTPLGLSILSDRFPPRRHPTAIGVFNVGAMLGVFLGLAIGGVVVAALGWRWVFFIAGIPGLIMALILALVETDPPRGAYGAAVNPLATPSARPRLGNVFVAMARSQVALFCAAGLVLCSALPAALSTWLPSFLIRVHQLPVQQAGLAAAVIGLVSAVGAGSGGALADWLGRDDPARKLLAPIVGCLGAALVGLGGLLFAGNAGLAVGLMAVSGFITSFYAGVGYAFVLGNMPATMRSTAAAIVLVATNVIAGGLGNLQVGLVSDLMAGFAGSASLAYGLASILIFNLAGSGVFWLALRQMRRPVDPPAPAPAFE